MNGKDTETKDSEVVQQKPMFSYGLKINGQEILPFCVCPFCFAVYNMSPAQLKSFSAKCNCGAAFSSLGVAAKYTENEVKS